MMKFIVPFMINRSFRGCYYLNRRSYSLVSKLINNNNKEVKNLKLIKEKIKDDLYIEIQRHFENNEKELILLNISMICHYRLLLQMKFFI